MGPNRNHDIEVTVRTSVFSGVALTADRNHAVIIDTCGNIDLDFNRFLDLSASMTVRTRFVNNLAGTSAVRTGAAALESAKGRVLYRMHLATAAALGAGPFRCSRGRSLAVALGTPNKLCHAQRFLRSKRRLLKTDRNILLQISTLPRAGSAGCLSETTAKSSAEHIAKSAEDILKTSRAAAEAAKASACAAEARIRIHSRKPEPVVFVLLVRV